MPLADGLGAGAAFEGGLLVELARFVGTTVTIFTTSGGISGSGITGVLTAVTPCVVKLITCIGPAPCCPLGSACTGRLGRFGFDRFDRFDRFGGGFGGFGCINNVGSETVIPVDRIAAFVHNAV